MGILNIFGEKRLKYLDKMPRSFLIKKRAYAYDKTDMTQATHHHLRIPPAPSNAPDLLSNACDMPSNAQLSDGKRSAMDGGGDKLRLLLPELHWSPHTRYAHAHYTSPLGKHSSGARVGVVGADSGFSPLPASGFITAHIVRQQIPFLVPPSVVIIQIIFREKSKLTSYEITNKIQEIKTGKATLAVKNSIRPSSAVELNSYKFVKSVQHMGR